MQVVIQVNFKYTLLRTKILCLNVVLLHEVWLLLLFLFVVVVEKEPWKTSGLWGEGCWRCEKADFFQGEFPSDDIVENAKTSADSECEYDLGHGLGGTP